MNLFSKYFVKKKFCLLKYKILRGYLDAISLLALTYQYEKYSDFYLF